MDRKWLRENALAFARLAAALLLLAGAWFAAGRFGDPLLERVLEKATGFEQTSKDAMVGIVAARALDLGSYAEMEATLERVLAVAAEEGADTAPVHFERERVAVWQRKWPEAYAARRQFIAAKGEDENVWYTGVLRQVAEGTLPPGHSREFLFDPLRCCGRWDEVLKGAEEALAKLPALPTEPPPEMVRDDQRRRAGVQLRIAEALVRLGRPEEAEPRLREAEILLHDAGGANATQWPKWSERLDLFSCLIHLELVRARHLAATGQPYDAVEAFFSAGARVYEFGEHTLPSAPVGITRRGWEFWRARVLEAIRADLADPELFYSQSEELSSRLRELEAALEGLTFNTAPAPTAPAPTEEPAPASPAP
ncbi:MAG: hypothetical protein SF028_15675 [Candidatus Sumerlaeia bacterium]|nr:hypothetical protein [Candidatus Sumerlaeia bacterium]